MSRKASPTLIGAFVLAAIALLVAGVLIFGGQELFRDTQRFVTYFDGSVQGLRIGSNVLFRGVRVGYVTDIQVTTDESMLKYKIPVTFEILPDAMTVMTDGQVFPLSATASRLDEMIKAGLRTQLDVESFVTGQLVVNLDMHPETEAVFRGQNSQLAEIPSIPSGIQQVLQRIQDFVANVQQNVPVDKVVETLLSALGGFNELVNSPDLRASLAGANQLINSRDTQALPARLRAAIVDLHATTRDARALIGNVDRRLDPALERALPLMEQLEGTLKEGEVVLSLARGQLESNPETAAQLADALRELERSARAIRVLVDTLERKPEALIRGKSKP
ncbi:MAG: MCE family protein [Chromatiales bacterium]|jgi:paraquat-inducible protein B|nr:MAG: MCE family protein [Chromatiales bacterium]